MKKIYFTIFSALFCTQISNAQLTLTKAFNEPVIGDINTSHRWDSTSVLDNNSGPNTFWDFSTLTTNTAVSMSTYTTVASTPSASTYPNATFAEDAGGGTYNYWKAATSPTTQLELLGIAQTSLSLNLNSNSAIAYIWPITYGYNKTDAFSGTAVVQTSTANLTGTANGNVHTIASGTGTLLLPGNLSFSNALQLTSTQTINVALSIGPFPAGTATIVTTNYQYYHASQKFPILSVSYQTISGSFSGNSVSIRVNTSGTSGINENHLNAVNFSVYPNPANDQLTIALANTRSENVLVTITNNMGQLVRTIQLGNATDINKQIDLSGMSNGIYFVRTAVGDVSSSKKFIKQ